ncbi:restriction endonuclease subunit S [Aliidiomarina soli]|uniref:Type I restriction modification DNA specificity domain-containing protein n=1 Tax=Aliidiomarina soli TaxID=1928574 RepID=A0A432WF53_9GAMM|nr:restriction endonuclease subunit S [Aliidiomarina soli]RUO32426.1 hypothetical protein CWE14_09770 [Aliidiomarina soli]
MSDKQTVKFGEIAEQIMDRVTPSPEDSGSFIGLEHLRPGYFYVHEWGAEIALKTQAFKIREGDIIFSRRNTYLKRVSVSPIDGICSADAMVIRSRKNSYMLDRYLPHFMQSSVFMEKVISNSAGSLSSRVKWGELSKLEFKLPRIDQQKSTLAALDSLANNERLYFESIQAAKRFLYAIGLRIFDNYFDPREEKRVSLPCGWSASTVKKILTSTPESGFSPVETSKHTGKYVLNLNSLSKVGFRETTLKNITEEHFLKGKVCSTGDLFISRSNTSELVGLVGKYKSSRGVGDTIFPDTMWRLNVDERLIKKDFLMFYLMSPYGRRAIQSIAAGTSGSMKKINKDSFSKLKLPLPPIAVQESIISAFQQSYGVIWHQDDSLIKSVKLRQVIIDREL